MKSAALKPREGLLAPACCKILNTVRMRVVRIGQRTPHTSPMNVRSISRPARTRCRHHGAPGRASASRSMFLEEALHILDVLHGLAVYAEDHVAEPKTGGRSPTAVAHVTDDDSR